MLREWLELVVSLSGFAARLWPFGGRVVGQHSGDAVG